MTVVNDAFLVAHLVTMVATLVVMVVMRRQAASAQRALTDDLRAVLPTHNWAARLLHLGVAVGVVVSVTGGADQRLSLPWVQTGMACYLVAALVLEGVVLPAERRVKRGGEYEAWWGRGLDVIATALVIAMVAMVVQF
jgi:hypothetical protein